MRIPILQIAGALSPKRKRGPHPGFPKLFLKLACTYDMEVADYSDLLTKFLLNHVMIQ